MIVRDSDRVFTLQSTENIVDDGVSSEFARNIMRNVVWEVSCSLEGFNQQLLRTHIEGR